MTDYKEKQRTFRNLARKSSRAWPLAPQLRGVPHVKPETLSAHVMRGWRIHPFYAQQLRKAGLAK